ncbi:MAG TPA: hypothetical protein PKW37_01180 [Salinivirgaceae bacterium]|nr:hypothetical protein [Salinivirgaceae bacterium]
MRKNIFLSILSSVLILLLLYGCSKENKFAVRTKRATSITANSAITGGEFTDTKVSPPTEFGVCWATHPMPTLKDNKVIGEGEYTDFFCLLTELTPATKYYVSAYAINNVGIVYAPAISFTTKK